MDNKRYHLLQSCVLDIYRYIITLGPHKDPQCREIIITHFIDERPEVNPLAQGQKASK